MLKKFSGKGHNALVNKRWCSFVLGQEGVAHWRTSRDAAEANKIRIAECTKDDPTVSWTARLCAMALCNDVAGLRTAFNDKADKTQGYGAAMKEQGIVDDHDDDLSHTYGTEEEDDDDDDFGDMYRDFEALPSNHPFYHYCSIRSMEDEYMEEPGMKQLDYLVSIAYCAATAGATDALTFLQEYEGQSFWDVAFDQKGDTFLSSLVQYACAHSTLEGPVHSIRTLLAEREMFMKEHFTFVEEMLHARHGGGLANHLHLAAASNHIGLVQVLLDGGMNPSKPCENKRTLGADRTNGCKELSLPEDWAQVRGHTEVAELLRQCKKGQRPNNQRGHSTYKSGSLTTFFPRADRQYGFINGKVFVHLTTLRESSSQGSTTNQGFPLPGQKLLFVTSKDRRGREKAIHVVDGTDKSYLQLPILERHEAERAWQHYDQNGTDESDSEDDEEEEDDGYGGNYNDEEDRWGSRVDYDEEEDCYGGDYY
eukprot:scaffold110317_cov55-Attheya_sp.AAC.1